MDLAKEIEAYIPTNEQEARDKAQMLRFLAANDDCLLRENEIAHFTASIWTVNRARTRTLMVYHNIFDSWSWIGGHADGESDLRAVALRELREETGVAHARLVTDDIFSLETLTVDGHIKRGIYVPSHLHLNVTFLAEAEEHDALSIKADENKGVRWFPLAEALTAPTEPWMVERIYKKLVEKCVHD